MIDLRIGARTDDECIAILNQQQHEDVCELRISDGAIPFRVAAAVRDLLLYSDYDGTTSWTVSLDGCYPADDVVSPILEQALSANIKNLTIALPSGDSKKSMLLLNALFSPSSYETLSTSLKEVTLQGSFDDDSNLAQAASEWLSELTSVQMLTLEERGTPWGNSAPFFTLLFELSWHHPRELKLSSTQISASVIEPLTKWTESEVLSICGCNILRGVGLDRLTQLRSLAIPDRGNFGPLRSSGIIDLLTRSESRLVDLNLSGYSLRTRGIVTLFQTLENNGKLERLQVVRLDDNQDIIKAVHACLASPSSRIRYLSIRSGSEYNIDSEFFGYDSQKIFVEVLEKNIFLEYFSTGDGDFDSAMYPNLLENFVMNTKPRSAHLPPSLWPLLLTRFRPWERKCEWAEYYELNRRHTDAVYSLLRGSNMLHTVSME